MNCTLVCTAPFQSCSTDVSTLQNISFPLSEDIEFNCKLHESHFSVCRSNGAVELFFDFTLHYILDIRRNIIVHRLDIAIEFFSSPTEQLNYFDIAFYFR
jgi:hypothetical protein